MDYQTHERNNTMSTKKKQIEPEKALKILQTAFQLAEACGVPILAIDVANNAVTVTIGDVTYRDGDLILLAPAEGVTE